MRVEVRSARLRFDRLRPGDSMAFVAAVRRRRQLEQSVVGAAGTHERHPEGQPARPAAGRGRHRGQPERVHERGQPPQFEAGAEGVAQCFRERRRTRHGGDDERVDGRPPRSRAASSRCFHRRIPGAHELRRPVLAPPAHDVEHRRVHGVGMREGERTERGEAFGDERAAVHERARVVHRSGVDGLDGAAEVDELLHHSLEARAGVVVAVPVDRRGHADAREWSCRHRRGAPTRRRTRRAASAEVAVNTDTQSNDRTPARRRRSISTPGVGFAPTMPHKRRGHPAGAGGVGAERERHLAGGDRRPPSRSSSRPAISVGIERVAAARRSAATGCRRGRWRTGRGWSCPTKTAPAASSCSTTGAERSGHVGELGAPGGRRHAGDVDVVLHRERHARERELGARRRARRRARRHAPRARPATPG